MTNFINIENNQNKIKIKNFFLISSGFGFVWIMFHFTVIFFFGITLGSILLTGLFLGLGNFVALVIDIPVGVALNYIKSKTMFLISIVLLLFESLIFFKFVLFADTVGLSKGLGDFASTLDYFLNSTANLILVTMCAVFYGFIKEIFDVTSLSYIMDNSDNDDLSSNISKSNTFFGGGALLGLGMSGFVLSLEPFISVMILITFIFLYFIFILIFFDNKDYFISIESIKNFKLTEVIKGKKQISNINKDRLKDIFSKISTGAGDMKPIFINPMKLKNKFEFKEFKTNSLNEFRNTKNVLFYKPYYILLVWLVILAIFYSFLDTFISAFQISFLEKILGENKDNLIAKMTNAYILLGIIIIPAFTMQIFFINKSKKYGILNILKLGIFMSAISLIGFGLTSNLLFIIIFGVGNSLGYAAVMPLVQSSFSDVYSEHYAKVKGLKEIDSNISAAPLKMLFNFANVLGLVFGGILVSIFNFDGFFIIYGILLLIFLFFTFKYKDKINL